MALELKYCDARVWQISPYLAESLSVQAGESIWLYVGAERRQVVVAIHEDYSCMNLNKQWADELKLTPGKWKVRRVANGVRLGPIIGLVCKNRPSRSPVGSTWSRYLTGIDGGLGILLTPEGFNQELRCTHGLTLSQDRLRWVERELPWPDAIYVRVYPVDYPFKEFLNKEFPCCHFNTQTLLNKWLVFQLLSSKQDIATYLPATAILDDDPGSLRNWVERYSAVYVKPVLGHKGFGVMKITANHGKYQIQYRQDQQNKQITLPLSVSIRTELTGIMGQSQYIMQQALVLPEHRNRTCDFRVLMQKMDDGLWHVTGLAGRRGPTGSIVNNVDSGGERIHLTRILETGTVPKAQRMQEIYQLCLRTALAIEGCFGQLGEIGLDLCIDCQEHLWVLEVNGMPDKSLFTEFYSPNVAKSVYGAPMLYATYLSGFSDVIYPLAPQD